MKKIQISRAVYAHCKAKGAPLGKAVVTETESNGARLLVWIDSPSKGQLRTPAKKAGLVWFALSIELWKKFAGERKVRSQGNHRPTLRSLIETALLS